MGDNTFKFFAVFFFLFSLWIVYENRKDKVLTNDLNHKKIDSLNVRIKFLERERDSLFSSLYPCEIELNRFHVGFRILEDRNPKSAEELGDIISNETE